jgi:hypothetical protein
VLTPGTPLGLLTNAVQTLAGVLLPSATVFLLLLCNDKAVLGPWVNSRGVNIFTCVVIGLLVMLSIILTASVMFPDMDETYIVGILVGGTMLGFAKAAIGWLVQRDRGEAAEGPIDRSQKISWRMPPLSELTPARLTTLNQFWMIVLRFYLVIAGGLVLVRIVQLATFGNG